VRTPLTQQHKILSQNTIDPKLSHCEKTEVSISPGLNQYTIMSDGQNFQTDEQMDKITIANISVIMKQMWYIKTCRNDQKLKHAAKE